MGGDGARLGTVSRTRGGPRRRRCDGRLRGRRVSSLPVRKDEAALRLLLCHILKGGKKIDSRREFDAVPGRHALVEGGGLAVAQHKADGGDSPFRSLVNNDFPEVRRNRYPIADSPEGLVPVKSRAGIDPKLMPPVESGQKEQLAHEEKTVSEATNIMPGQAIFGSVSV